MNAEKHGMRGKKWQELVQALREQEEVLSWF